MNEHLQLQNHILDPEADEATPKTEQLRSLKEEIQRSGGVIRVIVHPFFDEYAKDYFEHPPAQKKEAIQVQESFKKLATSESDKKIPTIVLEDHRHVQRTIDQIPGSSRLYFIPTFKDNPTPSLADNETDRVPEEELWESFAKGLEELGVERIILSGVNLDYSDNNPEELLQCVGKTHRNLSKHFKIEMSRMTYPKKV